MPDAIKDAIARASTGSGPLDKSWREKLIERYGKRWKVPKYRVFDNANGSVDATEPGVPARHRTALAPMRRQSAEPPAREGHPPPQLPFNVGTKAGGQDAHKTQGEPDLADYVWRSAEDGGFGRGILGRRSAAGATLGCAYVDVAEPLRLSKTGHPSDGAATGRRDPVRVDGVEAS